MKKITAVFLLCLLLSVRPAAKDGDVMYNTEVLITRFYTSTIIYPVFDGDWNTRRVKSAARELADRGAEYILEQAVREGCEQDEYSLRVDSAPTLSKEGTVRVTLTLYVYKNGVIENMDIRVLYFRQRSAENALLEI